jgi:hypothetical protein
MAANRLGRLEAVELRNIWTSESSDFTPWLAQEENLVLLGDAIGIELELEAQEKNVGPFRADILCKDTATGHWVLVENQLERTDHTHLGQLLTYAAGLKAVTIVWIAFRFTEEHRAALDWLNEITDDRFNFFGLEIEAWRIGNSEPAPKFNVISKPNDWSRSVGSAASQIETAGLSERQSIQLAYWTAFREVVAERKGPVKPAKPQAQAWLMFAAGRSDVRLVATANFQRNRITCQVSTFGQYSKAIFHRLLAQRGAIEAELGEKLDWRERPDMKESHVVLELANQDPADESQWQTQHAWLAERLDALHRAFAPRVKQLDMSDFDSGADGE